MARQMAHFAGDLGGDEAFLAESAGFLTRRQVPLQGVQGPCSIVDFSVELSIAVDLSNEVPLIELVDGVTEDGKLSRWSP